ncbi:MAG: hypothetical protein Fur0023_21000 [Bacteroidia bacterium]
MKKTSISLALIGGIFFSACKKENQEVKNNEPAVKPNASAIEIKQKIIVAPHTLIVGKIKEFKNNKNKNVALYKTSSAPNISADSALWLLESALNYDFDVNTTDYNYLNDSTGYIISLSGGDSITLSDLNVVYAYFNSYIAGKINSNKLVKIIDVYAYKSNNQITISASIVFSETTTGNRTESVCDPYSNITARWSYPLTNTPPFTYCTNYTTNNDGPTLCNIKLNCTQYNPPCNPYFFTNVVTYTFDNMTNQYPNALFYFTGPGSFNVVCTVPVLTDVQLNNYINGCKTLAISNIPSTPGYIITNYSVNATMYVQPPNPPHGGYSILWWYLKVTYAIPTCNGGGN